MPFGLKCAAQTFQRFIDGVLRGFHFAAAYVDDLLVYSRNEEDHTHHLEQIFRRLHEHGLHLQLSKCKFFCNEFLGHLVSAKGVQPLFSRTEAIQNWPTPSTSQALHCKNF